MRPVHHDLSHDFPEFQARIHALRQSDPQFARLYDDYQALDNEVYQAETDGRYVADAEMEDMKKRRAQLKDQLYRVLSAS